VRGNPSQEYANTRRQIAEVTNNTLSRCKLDLVQLQRRTQYELEQVDKWKTRAKNRVSSIDKPKPVTPGRITAIISSDNSFGAMVGTEFVREGDTIDGIKIVKISKDKVEFEKNGKRWTQGWEETPGPEWQ